ncbi:MAG: dihydrofolate reductase family protein, partial [Verrucomicrobia bacterium]|nr:dihydrofolate reductase family protein [Verrucomicrobiota bacterium]
LVCEGGGVLNAALLRGGLVDELHVTIAPIVCGGRSAPTLADGLGAARLAGADRLRLRLMTRRRAGDELFLVYRVARGGGAGGRALQKISACVGPRQSV